MNCKTSTSARKHKFTHVNQYRNEVWWIGDFRATRGPARFISHDKLTFESQPAGERVFPAAFSPAPSGAWKHKFTHVNQYRNEVWWIGDFRASRGPARFISHDKLTFGSRPAGERVFSAASSPAPSGAWKRKFTHVNQYRKRYGK